MEVTQQNTVLKLKASVRRANSDILPFRLKN